MINNQLARQIFALSITLGISLQLVTPAFSADGFAAGWQAKPLVDYSQKPLTPSQSSTTTSATPAPSAADQAALEAKLKPAEPFIASVEKQLTLTPQTGDSLVNRLNTLQSVLYGGQKYQDAGELLAQLATLFPAEAAKAQANLNAKLQNSLPPATANRKPIVTGPQTASAAPPSGYPSASYPPTSFGNAQSAQPQTQKKKHFWSNNDDPFKNDPFFQDHPSSYQSQQQSQSGPSKLGALGQGLAGLAMMAGAVAGSYYMNKNSGGLYPNNGYYNNPGYGYGGNYGYPYGYNGYAPSYGYGGYGGVYGSPYYGSPFGGISVTTQPYQRYGTTTTGTSPLGVPTGLYPY